MRILLPRIWRSRGPAARALLPLSWVYRAVVAARRGCYRTGLCRTTRFSRPVIVIGGITVGGSGKTPLTLYVAELLAGRGYRPGIVSRGYGGRPGSTPLRVDKDTPPSECGDEPAMMARRLGLPVVVDMDRPRGVQCLIDALDCDVVISDDGLQHYAMGRKVEIAVVGRNGLGNGWCLPAGPLREPASRLEEVDIVVRNGGSRDAGELGMALAIDGLKRLDGETDKPVAAFEGQEVHAVAGTGHPDAFFDMLRGLGMTVEPHAFPDHWQYGAADFANMGDGAPIVMTEKDAVKCKGIALDNAWYAKAVAIPDEGFNKTLIELLQP